eukprot:TRINITY_DN1118_c0_g1_i3.p1 TRINITY_DN1118_c0_g1~~TRINITY_DN1118_c0_g1_i3.p1  ORF type:complete len:116 (-),score=5.90 TRINITY_DN1118_c0_g1_i3:977-1324(-)
MSSNFLLLLFHHLRPIKNQSFLIYTAAADKIVTNRPHKKRRTSFPNICLLNWTSSSIAQSSLSSSSSKPCPNYVGVRYMSFVSPFQTILGHYLKIHIVTTQLPSWFENSFLSSFQ